MNDVLRAPTLNSAEWLTDGSIRIRWTNNAFTDGTYSRIYVYARVGGTWQQINSFGYPAISQQQYDLWSGPNGARWNISQGYEIALRASGSLPMSPYSGSRSVSGLSTPTPTLLSVSRLSASSARVLLNQNHSAPAVTDHTDVFIRPEGVGGATRHGSTSDGRRTQYDVTGLQGDRTYDVYLSAVGPAGRSGNSSERTIPTWWDSPVAPQITGHERSGSGATVMTWSGSPTQQNPWNSIEVWRGEGAVGALSRIATLPGSARSYTDTGSHPARAYRYEIRAIGPAGSTSASFSTSATTDVPSAPSSVQATLSGNSSVSVSWSRSVSESRPYTSQRVGWRDVGSTGWTWTTVSGTATTATLGVGENRRVEVTVQAFNAAGSSEMAAPSSPVVTRPAGPPSLTASWQGNNAIRVAIPSFSTVGDRIVLEFSTDGGDEWWPAATLAPNARSWTREDAVPTLDWRFRAWVESDEQGVPPSAVVLSNVARALTKPAPPSVSRPTVIDAREAQVIPVTHNPLDGSVQTAGELRHRVVGGSWATVSFGSDTATIPGGVYNNGDEIEVQARTAGASGELSDWPDPVSWDTRPRPVFALTGPAAVVQGQAATATWTASAQAGALVELLDADGGLVQSYAVDAAARTSVLEGLEDQTTYTVRLTGHDEWQPGLPVTRVFAAELERPGVPVVVPVFVDESAVVEVWGTGDDEVTRFEAFRQTPDGTWLSVGELEPEPDPDTGGTIARIIDPLPPLRPTLYRVRAYGVTGGWSESEPVASAAPAGFDFIINHGPGLRWLARASLNPGIRVQPGRMVTLRQYVGDDDPHPVWGDRKPYVLSGSFTLMDDVDGGTPLATWESIMQDGGPVVWRDPAGRVMEGVLDGFSADDSRSDIQTIGFTFTRTKQVA